MLAALLQFFLGFILQILSRTFFHILFPAIWLTIACNLPPPLPIDFRQQTKILPLYSPCLMREGDERFTVRGMNENPIFVQSGE